MSRNGRCLCGAVTYEITSPVAEMGPCHCSMCRRWSGGVFLGVEVPTDGMQIEGEVSRYASSAWAERCFCAQCGTSLWYRLTMPGPHHGTYHVGLGTMDDPSNITLSSEIFIDSKPDAYAFAGTHPTMTEAEFMAMVAALPQA